MKIHFNISPISNEKLINYLSSKYGKDLNNFVIIAKNKKYSITSSFMTNFKRNKNFDKKDIIEQKILKTQRFFKLYLKKKKLKMIREIWLQLNS